MCALGLRLNHWTSSRLPNMGGDFALKFAGKEDGILESLDATNHRAWRAQLKSAHRRSLAKFGNGEPTMP